jgi:hypothetical protein
VDEAVYLLFHSPGRMLQMVDALNAISPADPSARLAEFILGLV